MHCIFNNQGDEPKKGGLRQIDYIIAVSKKQKDDKLRLSMDETWIVKWYLDALFAVHNDMRSQTGAIMTLGKGAVQVVSTKQKTNTRSSTEAELISFDDIASKVLWTKLFLNEQGYQVKDNIIYRDNQAAMKLEMNGKTSSGKRTRHFDIKYFFILDK